MTTILALETSSLRASLALVRDGACLERELDGTGPAHSGSILPAVRQLLAEAGLGLGQLDLIAFGRGPGAFTGVRLACGVAQGLALGAGLPVAAISSLQALARGAAVQGQGQRFYCALDARMDELYVACFEQKAGRFQTVVASQCLPPEDAPVPDTPDWIGVGNAFRVFGERLASRLDGRVAIQDADALPRAASVAALALGDPSLWQDPALAAPEYVRNRVAATVAERLAMGGRA